jgi:dolichol kinase
VTVSALLVEPLPLLVCALLYLIFGDTAASLVGKRLQGPRWPGSEKRFSGSLACLTVCLIIGATLLRPMYGWHGVVAGAITATLLEWSVLPINDNLTIPVGSSLVLLACYQVKPLSFFLS